MIGTDTGVKDSMVQGHDGVVGRSKCTACVCVRACEVVLTNGNAAFLLSLFLVPSEMGKEKKKSITSHLSQHNKE